MSITSPITEWTGFYGYSVLVSSGLCLLSWLVNIIYIVATLRTEAQAAIQCRRQRQQTFAIQRQQDELGGDAADPTPGTPMHPTAKNIGNISLQCDQRQPLSPVDAQDVQKVSKPCLSITKAVTQLPLTYWLLLYTGIFMAGCWSPFLDVTSEFLQKRFGDFGLDVSWSKRGINSLLLPICLSSVFGFIMDRIPSRRPLFGAFWQFL